MGSRLYFYYSTETLKKCLAAIRSGTQKLTAISTYGIPVRSLTNKRKGCHEKKPGGQVLFSPDKESSFVSHLSKLSEYGFSMCSDDLRYVVATYLKKEAELLINLKIMFLEMNGQSYL